MLPDIMLVILSHSTMETKAAGIQLENRLRDKRQALALSQKQLAEMAGITRQAVSALEANQYSPATSVALQLARSLRCRVEDLFSIKQGGDTLEGELLGVLSAEYCPGPRSGEPGRTPTPGAATYRYWRINGSRRTGRWFNHRKQCRHEPGYRQIAKRLRRGTP